MCSNCLPPSCPHADPSEDFAPTTRRAPQFENERVEVWKSVIVLNQPREVHSYDNPRAIIAPKECG